ncbi:MAG: DUF523 domain-containing protein [Sulfurimonas sp.]|nr:DUF523 domain-containing protein [Sulfurimonas sp.]MBU3940260.1 DUF523 domain-containing protein [bacterium]MBU4024307.1 DUF523 domain-containing protein [bacterium]MBU4058108.1 DUF523 domain-containing protein [bacterium]MBU4110815.1 DUF523 domain-containing protein [bacterium]
MQKKKVIISACILGEYCRYDGETKMLNAVVTAFSDYEIIPFCPEAPLFGTPRERIDVVDVNGENRIITHETNKDVTELLREEIAAFIRANPNADRIVLKSKSPSCGYGTTPVLNEKKEPQKMGNGIAASMFEKHYAPLKIESESDF